MKSYIPYGKNILIQKSKKEQDLKKGNLLLINDVKPFYQAYVVDTPCDFEDLDLRDSDVLVHSYAGIKIDEDEDVIYLLVKEEDILCTILED
jgi:co-chaperonin GroES (HSP10)